MTGWDQASVIFAGVSAAATAAAVVVATIIGFKQHRLADRVARLEIQRVRRETTPDLLIRDTQGGSLSARRATRTFEVVNDGAVAARGAHADALLGPKVVWTCGPFDVEAGERVTLDPEFPLDRLAARDPLPTFDAPIGLRVRLRDGSVVAWNGDRFDPLEVGVEWW
jgi:hypothetical protein